MLDKPESGELESKIGRNKAKLGLEREVERACRQLHLVLRVMPLPGTARSYLESYASEAQVVSPRMGTGGRQADDALVFILESHSALHF